jgi:hypothetical protein
MKDLLVANGGMCEVKSISSAIFIVHLLLSNCINITIDAMTEGGGGGTGMGHGPLQNMEK